MHEATLVTALETPIVLLNTHLVLWRQWLSRSCTARRFAHAYHSWSQMFYLVLRTLLSKFALRGKEKLVGDPNFWSRMCALELAQSMRFAWIGTFFVIRHESNVLEC